MTRTTTPSSSLGRAILVGAGAGILAALVMAMYAMIAGWAKGAGFFTSLYHIASLWASPNTMMASMEDGMAGNPFHFEFGPAVLGVAIHMMTAAGYGAVFGLLVARLRLGTAALVIGLDHVPCGLHGNAASRSIFVRCIVVRAE